MSHARRSHVWLKRSLAVLPGQVLAALDAWSARLALRRAEQRRRARLLSPPP